MTTINKTMGKENKTTGSCFVIMPFGGWFDKYYNDIFFEAIKDSGLNAKRADDLYRSSPIINDIWEFTKNATVILADLTDKNPNVLYELGLAHAIQKPAILVTETIDDVPFDLRALRVIVYDKNESDWGDKLKVKITSSIKETIKSPLSRVLPTFLKVDESLSQKVSFGQKEFLDLKNEVDLLKIKVSSTHKQIFTKPPNILDIEGTIRSRLKKGESEKMISLFISGYYNLTDETTEDIVHEYFKLRKMI